ncbi:MAG: hypothetical protein MR555_03920 [Spirochaetia bacterium]|nr:hypothetical protein [Spirochaetia bacterium]MDY3885800.1 hypothetical protein [Treponema sp.]
MSLKKVKITALILIFSLFAQNLFSAESKTPEPYSDNEFPGFLYDLRRAEIITLGAMPFITFNATLGYSLGKFAFNNFDSQYFVNPFAQSSDSSFSTDEQIGIILTSLGISLCIGITDFIVNSVKRSNAKKKINNPVKINPIKNDPDAIQLPSSKQTLEEDFSNDLQEENLLDDENYSDKNSIESSSKNIKNAKKLKVN